MTRKHQLLFVVPLVAALALGMGGCGGDESVGPTLTKAEFLKKADLVCEEAGNEQLEIAAAYIEKHPGAEEKDYVAQAAIPPLENQVRNLKALGLPNKDKATLVAYFSEFEKDLAAAKEEPLKILSENDNPFARTVKLGEKYGFVGCAVIP
jgi:hypothetical protein